jgi:hypothetical protein
LFKYQYKTYLRGCNPCFEAMILRENYSILRENYSIVELQIEVFILFFLYIYIYSTTLITITISNEHKINFIGKLDMSSFINKIYFIIIVIS